MRSVSSAPCASCAWRDLFTAASWGQARVQEAMVTMIKSRRVFKYCNLNPEKVHVFSSTKTLVSIFATIRVIRDWTLLRRAAVTGGKLLVEFQQVVSRAKIQERKMPSSRASSQSGPRTPPRNRKPASPWPPPGSWHRENGHQVVAHTTRISLKFDGLKPSNLYRRLSNLHYIRRSTVEHSRGIQPRRTYHFIFDGTIEHSVSLTVSEHCRI
jgi:hypothetical protein